MDLKSNLGSFIPGIFFIIISLISVFILIIQGVFSPVLILMIILGVASGIGVLIRNKAGIYLSVISTPIILTAFIFTAYYSINMFGSNYNVFLGYQAALIILAALWLIMSIVVVDNREKFKK